nr:MAG TPA: Proline racemase RACEMASE, PROPOSED 3-OH PROLINE.9A [Caudoviricetes sp.]
MRLLRVEQSTYKWFSVLCSATPRGEISVCGHESLFGA